MVDDLARAVHVEGLEMGSWIGDFELAIDAVFVERACLEARDCQLMPTTIVDLHRVCAIEHELNPSRRRRPETECDTVWLELCTKAGL
jgi:hypothetical protein